MKSKLLLIITAVIILCSITGITSVKKGQDKINQLKDSVETVVKSYDPTTISINKVEPSQNGFTVNYSTKNDESKAIELSPSQISDSVMRSIIFYQKVKFWGLFITIAPIGLSAILGVLRLILRFTR